MEEQDVDLGLVGRSLLARHEHVAEHLDAPRQLAVLDAVLDEVLAQAARPLPHSDDDLPEQAGLLALDPSHQAHALLLLLRRRAASTSASASSDAHAAAACAISNGSDVFGVGAGRADGSGSGTGATGSAG